jgi:DNA-binding IclR family transcriptional regulator
MRKTESRKAGSQTVQRAVQILRRVARYPDKGLRLLDVAREMGIERPTAHRVLQTLCAEGLLLQDESRRYRIGPLLFELCLLSGGYSDLAEACMPVLTDLADKVGDTAFLFVRYGDDAICLARKQGWYHIQTPVVAVNSRHPLGVSAGGLAILAGIPEREAANILHGLAPYLSVYNGLTAEEVWKLYQDARVRGYAVISDRVVPGVKGVGVPIRSELGNPIAGVAVATTIDHMPDERVTEIAPLLLNAAVAITGLMQSRRGRPGSIAFGVESATHSVSTRNDA